MGRKEELIEEIVGIEWEMLQAVKDSEGKVSCQDYPENFKIIRTANFMTWSETTLASYLSDLKEAQRRGENLMMLKYARMEKLIPSLHPEAERLIDKIVHRECLWAEEFTRNNPNVELARPIYSSQDSPEMVSSETYSRCELETYSSRTLDYYYHDTLEMSYKGLNRVEMAVRFMEELAGEAREKFQN